jgi:hypothetical protein
MDIIERYNASQLFDANEFGYLYQNSVYISIKNGSNSYMKIL